MYYLVNTKFTHFDLFIYTMSGGKAKNRRTLTS